MNQKIICFVLCLFIGGSVFAKSRRKRRYTRHRYTRKTTQCFNPKKGCLEAGSLIEWSVYDVDDFGNATLFKIAPGVGYFVGNSIEVNGSIAYFSGEELNVLAFPVGVFFYLKLDRLKRTYLFGGPTIGFFRAWLDSLGKNGFLVGVIGGIKYNLRKLSKRFYLATGISFLYARARINVITFTPSFGCSWFF